MCPGKQRRASLMKHCERRKTFQRGKTKTFWAWPTFVVSVVSHSIGRDDADVGES